MYKIYQNLVFANVAFFLYMLIFAKNQRRHVFICVLSIQSGWQGVCFCP